MIIGLQLISLAFAFVMLYFATLHYRRHELTTQEVFIWSIVWIFAILAVVFPDLLQTFAREFKFARLFDMMVVGGLILVITMVSKVYISARKMEKKLEDLVRSNTLKDVKKNK